MAKTIDAAEQFYLEVGGIQCPRCKSSDITTTDALDTDGDLTWQPVRCEQCGLRWTDYYRLCEIDVDEEFMNPDGTLKEVGND